MTASYSFGQPDRVATTTRKKVLDAADRLGFRGPDPSGRLLRTGGLRSLGLVLGESLEYAFEDPQATRFLAGMARECAGAGYGLTIIPTTGEATDRERVRSAAVDAFVVWTTTADDPVLGAIRDTRRRAVVHGGPDVDGFALVGIDDRAAARALANAVWDDADAPGVISFPLDRSREAGILHDVDPDDVPFPVTRNRLAGFRDAAESLGLDWASIPIAVCARNHWDDAKRVAQEIAAAGYLVDGLVAMSDLQALAAYDVLAGNNPTVSRSVRLGGFDGSERALALGIASIGQMLDSQGARAARIALGLEEECPDATEAWSLHT